MLKFAVYWYRTRQYLTQSTIINLLLQRNYLKILLGGRWGVVSERGGGVATTFNSLQLLEITVLTNAIPNLLLIWNQDGDAEFDKKVHIGSSCPCGVQVHGHCSQKINFCVDTSMDWYKSPSFLGSH